MRSSRSSSSSSSSSRPRLLDLFCGAGGASVGYYKAGFDVVGVDIRSYSRYPLKLVPYDALEILGLLSRCGPGPYKAIHASPPCQHYSDLAHRNANRSSHPDLIGTVRERLIEIGLPYVIENVEGAPLIDPVMVCGSALGLGTSEYRLRRHRLFESNVPLNGTGCGCDADPRPVIDVTGGGRQLAPRKKLTGGLTYKGTADERREAMGIPWMTRDELTEAIPPAYTKFLGEQLAKHLSGVI